MKASLTLEIIAGWHSVIVNALFLSVCIVNSVFVLLLNNLTQFRRPVYSSPIPAAVCPEFRFRLKCPKSDTLLLSVCTGTQSCVSSIALVRRFLHSVFPSLFILTTTIMVA